MNADLRFRLKQLIEDEQNSLAHDAMFNPADGEFSHGVQVGTYRGLGRALMIIDDLFKARLIDDDRD